MKKKYVRPAMESETFITDEYIAACWTVWCNVPSGIGYIEKNGRKGYQAYEDVYIVSGSGCEVSHTASGIDAAGPAANAMWDPYGGEPFEVFYWKNFRHGSGHHFSKVEDAEWKENPNASN